MNLEVNIVGSVPLDDAEAVFTSLATQLGPYLKRLPDGETGPLRSKWILCQIPVFQATPAFETLSEEESRKCSATPVGLPPAVRLRTTPIRFGELGYARWAIESWRAFRRLKRNGTVPRAARLQVCIPTPFAVVNRVVNPGDHVVVLATYHEAMREEIKQMLTVIPHEELCVQLDVCHEVGVWEGIWPTYIPDAKRAVLERVADLADTLPAEAELGYHICYGDFGHKHFVEPKDAGVLTAISNELRGLTRHHIAYIQMPVPRARDDDAFFLPLRELDLDPGTTVFLGLVHATDGVSGAERRIAAARRRLPSFGISTECGWGRRDPASIPNLIELHADIVKTMLPH